MQAITVVFYLMDRLYDRINQSAYCLQMARQEREFRRRLDAMKLMDENKVRLQGGIENLILARQIECAKAGD